MNPAILKLAPAEAIQFGCTLLRYLYSIHHPNNEKLWSGVCIQPKDNIHVKALFLLHPTGESKLIDIPPTNPTGSVALLLNF